ncbi:hypothetical protein CASFOL_008013 [Castilleja foliolosa]|uniref:Uncharacterized protein n=1 Tax=Castilleja foliolosa TaxID=1961234 RepID=A0ABD3DXR9_9LAMI
MFTQQEMTSFYGVLQHTEEFVEMDCGCTNPRYGDTPGKLRIFVNGKIEIDCICRDDCPRVNLSPVDFARHAGRTNAHTNWKSQIWVFNHDGQKLALRRTCLLKHHTEAFQRPLRQVIHRDEFKCCSRCNKDRRFSLRNKEACRVYHDALLNTDWKCSDMPNQSLSCREAEERECRKVIRGCPRASRCAGCEQCVCVGCDMCRFEDCNCRTCAEFILNM